MESEHNILEKDIERLIKEVQEHQAEHGAEKIDESAIKAVLESRLRQTPKVVNFQPSGPTEPQDKSSPILPSYLDKESPEVKLKVEKLADAAFHHGIEKSVKEARKQGPFILDALHDALSSKLYEELKKRNLIK